MSVKRVKAHTMNRSEELPHLRSHFRQCGADNAKKMELVLRLRDVAIKLLEPVKAKNPRPMSELDIEAYQAKGISTEWDFTDYDDATTFGVLVSTGTIGAALSPSQKSAAALLSHCSEALRLNALPDRLRDWILDAYPGLDADAVNRGMQQKKNLVAGPQAASVKRKLKAAEEHTVMEKAVCDLLNHPDTMRWTNDAITQFVIDHKLSKLSSASTLKIVKRIAARERTKSRKP